MHPHNSHVLGFVWSLHVRCTYYTVGASRTNMQCHPRSPRLLCMSTMCIYIRILTAELIGSSFAYRWQKFLVVMDMHGLEFRGHVWYDGKSKFCHTAVSWSTHGRLWYFWYHTRGQENMAWSSATYLAGTYACSISYDARSISCYLASSFSNIYYPLIYLILTKPWQIKKLRKYFFILN